MGVPHIDTVWSRIEALEGEVFRQKGGKRFTSSILGNVWYPSTASQALPRTQFAKPLGLVPITGPGAINHLRGPSYLWAVLMNPRISRGDW